MNTSKRVMLITGVVILAGFLLLMFLPTDQPSERLLEFEPLDGQIALLDRAHESWFGEKPDTDDAVYDTVRCDWYMYKSLAAKDDPEWFETKSKLEADVMDLLSKHGGHSIFWAAESAFDELKAVYNGDAARRDQMIRTCTDYAPELSKIIDAEVNAFKDLAQSEDLLDADGRLKAEKEPIARLLHRKIWFLTMSEIISNSRLVSPEEEMAVFRWQIEQSQVMPFGAKLERLAEFEKRGMDYDYDYARAVLYEHNGMAAEACAIIQSALKKDGIREFRRNRYQKSLKIIQQAHPGACSDAVQ